MRANKWVAGVVLSGLCLCQPALTTAQTANTEAPGIVMPGPATQKAVQPVAQPQPVAKPGPKPATPGANLAAAKTVRLTLLLPLDSDSLGRAADAVRSGFLAAYDLESNGLSLNIVSTTDVAEEIVSSYTNALADSDIVIGPLTRSAATAIAQSGAVRLPTISLTQSDADSDSSTMPPQMLAMGLSVEDEAREVAGWIASNKVKKAYALYTSSAWQRRAAKAFAAKARSLGLAVETVELGSSYGFLSALDVDRLKKELQAEKNLANYAVFAALDAGQTKQLREAIGNEPAIYGTAQINPVPLPDRATFERLPELNGVRLLDIPWQLQPDHAAVMIYPRAVVDADQKRSADMERLYALGIDAFRVALLAARQQKQFEIDGVTGRLKASFDKDGAHFTRIEPFAIYREGLPAFLSEGH
ncbi:MAG TPA: penicillin-binding protein activator [Burkholderiaceae bacterium]